MNSEQVQVSGGSGAASHAIAVYGDMGAQHAGYGNVIAMNPVQQGGQYKFRMTRRGTARGSRRGTRRSKRTKMSMRKGGSGMASHAVGMYGNVNAGTPSTPQMGGKQSKSKRGGTTLTEFAVPAALLFATRFGSRRPSKNMSAKRSRKFRK